MTPFAHGPEVLTALAEPDALHRGKQPQLRNDMTHTDAATVLGVCIYIEFRDSCSVGPSL